MKIAETVLEELWFAEDDSKDAAEEASRSLAAKLAELDGLKPFPAVAQKILAILASPNFRVSAVTRALEEDPSLAAAAIRMANSPIFAGAKACSSIDQAFMRLGAKSVRDVVASVVTMQMFPDKGGIGKQVRDHCACTAAIVQTLTREFAPKFTEGIFLAGLMHDVGKLLLLESGEVNYSDRETNKITEPDQTHIDERSIIGYDHAVLGGHVLSKWKLPEPIPRVVAWHHQPSRAYEDNQIGSMVALLRIADQIDYIFCLDHEDVELYLDDVSKNVDCEYMRIGTLQLKAKLDAIYQARNDALSLFN